MACLGCEWAGYSHTHNDAEDGPREDCCAHTCELRTGLHNKTETETDDMTDKFEDAIAEAANAIILDGFADEMFGSVDEGGHYALVTMYPADGIAERTWAEAVGMARPALLTGSRVIIRTDEQGFVWRHYGPAHPTADPAAYRSLMGEWSLLFERATGETNAEAEALYDDLQGGD